MVRARLASFRRIRSVESGAGIAMAVGDSHGGVVITASPSISSVVLDRIRAEYVEMPDLRLTPWQAQRLFALGDDVSEAALERLVEHKFLARAAGGAYVRANSR